MSKRLTEEQRENLRDIVSAKLDRLIKVCSEMKYISQSRSSGGAIESYQELDRERESIYNEIVNMATK